MGFAREFSIGSRRVGAERPCFIIAEAGLAHLGSVDLALRMVAIAKQAGADAFKTQAFKPELLYAPGLWQERLRGRALPDWAFPVLQRECERLGLEFILTPHDDHGMGIVRELRPAAVKIGSGERGNTDFVSAAAMIGRPVILSTGMHAASNVRVAVDAVWDAGCTEMALLHCVTAYPVPKGQANVRRMLDLRTFGPVVGYSDHSAGALAAMSAVALGAKLLEVHFRCEAHCDTSNDLKVSYWPAGLAKLITMVREIEAELGPGGLDPRPIESEAESWAIKRDIGGVMQRAG